MQNLVLIQTVHVPETRRYISVPIERFESSASNI